MADNSGIDPRYAAQFQRGFDPAHHATAQHATLPAHRGPTRIGGGPPPSAPRVPDPPRMVATAAVEPTETAVPPPAEPAVAIPLTRWDWLLPGIGAAFALIAFAMWWSLATDSATYYGDGPNDTWALFGQHLRYALPAPLLTAGAFAVTAGIVLQAVRPRA
jgi:hypothetical protein